MFSKNTIKYIRSLHQKKFRQKYNNFIVEGDKMVCEMLQSPKTEIEAIYGLDSWAEKNQSLLSSYSAIFTEVSAKELKQISTLKTPHKVLLIAKQYQTHLDESILRRSFCIYLDDIQDPGNMGTILRIADWFSFPYVFCSPGCVEIYNPKVIQSTMGALNRVGVIPISLSELSSQYPNLNYLAALLDGENIFSTFVKCGVLIIGNESRGINKSLLPSHTKNITIPKSINGGAESLNAAVATGIIAAALQNQKGDR